MPSASYTQNTLGRRDMQAWIASSERTAVKLQDRAATAKERRPRTVAMAGGSWTEAAYQWLALGDIDKAADRMLRALRCAAHYTRLSWQEGTRPHLSPVLEYALIACDADVIAGVCATEDVTAVLHDDQLLLWSKILFALVAGDHDATKTAGDHYDSLVDRDNWRRERTYPGLGACAMAIIEDDEDRAQAAMVQLLKDCEYARRRSFRRNVRMFDSGIAALWRVATNRGLTIDIPERFHHVDLKFLVSNDFDFEGEPARLKPYTWTIDLLPLTFYDHVAALHAQRGPIT